MRGINLVLGFFVFGWITHAAPAHPTTRPIGASLLDHMTRTPHAVIKKVGDGYQIKSDNTSFAAAFASRESFRVPLVITLEVKADANDLCVFYGNGRLGFNEGKDNKALTHYDPRTGVTNSIADAGEIDKDKWVTIRWSIDDSTSTVEVDGVERASINGDYEGVNGTVAVGTLGKSTISLRALHVLPLPKGATAYMTSGSAAPELIHAAPGAKKLTKFGKPTTEEIAEAIAAAKAADREVEKRLDVKLETIETNHFIIFTDWDPREYNFLQNNLEQAYTVVARQFDVSKDDTVFVGKLPVFMFARHADFAKFAKDLDGFPKVVEGLMGYYGVSERIGAHMVMWKPDGKFENADMLTPEQLWARVLTHEFTHAFIARYRSDAWIPRWLNEGIAEVVATSIYPRPWLLAYVRERATQLHSMSEIFDDRKMFGGDDYPVVQSLVEILINRGGVKQFRRYVNDIKDGMKPLDALNVEYGIRDYHQLEEFWRRAIAN